MTFRETLQHVVEHGGLPKICTCIHAAYYSDEHKVHSKLMTTYKKVVNELLHLQENITNTNYSIYVTDGVDESDPDNVQTFIDVSLFDESRGEKYSIDFEDWNNIIDMNVHCTVSLDLHDLVAHILWEITFWGMSAASVKQAGVEMLKSVNEEQHTEIEFKLGKDHK